MIHLISAARPNFMKIAPLYHALKREDWAIPYIVHTGQHYDLNMSDTFFDDLGLPKADFNLGVGSGSHAEQTGQVMVNYEKVAQKGRPDLVVVVGDVNSTMAATLTAVKLGIKVGHLEAGLRSFDRTMPEEINRIVTDALAEMLWTPSPDADENLKKEGISTNRIFRVGNIMIDSLEMVREKIEKQCAYQEYSLKKSEYALITLHRPSNVDDPKNLTHICRVISSLAQSYQLLFPIHPRTKKNLEEQELLGRLERIPGLILISPMSYIGFMSLLSHCKFAVTDSGGIQEETTYLGIPCFTLRPNTERPITLTMGTNRLCTLVNLEDEIEVVLSRKRTLKRIELWDGQTASRVVASIKSVFCQ